MSKKSHPSVSSLLSKSVMVETCSFIPFSDLPFTEDAIQNISDSSSITFGDANRTLISADRFLDIDFDNKHDTKVVEILIAKYGPMCYIDLEN